MDTITIEKTEKQNTSVVSIPSSKSYIHRYIISAFLAGGGVIENVSFSNDIRATLSCIESLGAEVTVAGSTITVKRETSGVESACLDCGESASTLRFMIPVATLFSDTAVFRGSETLLKRPLTPYFEIFEKNGMKYDFTAGEHLNVSGSFRNREYTLDGNVSSQFVTGLLFTLPLMDFDSTLFIQGDLQSKPYVDITLEVLGKSGIEIVNRDYRSFFIKGSQKYKSGTYVAGGDYSQVAFFLVAGCISGGIECANMEHDSLQGDRAVVDILKKMNADIKETPRGFRVNKSRLVSPGEIDAADIPDIVPILSLACALAEGTTVIKNIERLRIKECDRAFATVDVLSRLGADIREKDGCLVINGISCLKGGRINSFNDHRMAMTAAVASLASEGSVTIENPMSINKSYPAFYEDLLSTGAVSIQGLEEE